MCFVRYIVIYLENICQRICHFYAILTKLTIQKMTKKFKLKIIIKLKLSECLKVLNVFFRDKTPNRDVCPNAT